MMELWMAGGLVSCHPGDKRLTPSERASGCGSKIVLMFKVPLPRVSASIPAQHLRSVEPERAG